MNALSIRRPLVALLLTTAPLGAQVHPGVGVRVVAPNVLLDRFTGVYVGSSGDTLIFGNDERGPVRVPAWAITQVEVSRGRSRWQGALHGALWGGGVGLLFGALAVASAPPGDSLAVMSGELLVAMAAGGAEIGAIVGAIVGRRVWARSQPRIFLNTARIDPHSLGVQLAMRYSR